ncbi:hypothetical protein ASF20_21860 [Methylobacterium sp. Leaf88]|nr:hypothetical protein ASF20_21860 [Methylobacterium sp. Leaf88]
MFHRVDHDAEMTDNQVVRETKNLKALVVEPSIAPGVTCLPEFRFVRLTVEFDDQPCRRTEEINDVGRDWHLPLEFMAVETTTSNLLPEQGLSPGHQAPLLPSKGAQTG